MSKDVIRTTVYLTRKNKQLLDTISSVTQETKLDILNTALDNYFKTLVKEKNLEGIIKVIDNQK